MDEALGVVNFGKEGKIKGRRASRFGLLEADSSFLFADLFEGSIEKVRMVSNLRKRYHTYCHNYRRFKLQTDPAFNLWRVILNCGCYYSTSGILLGAIIVQELLRIWAAVGVIAVTPWRFLFLLVIQRVRVHLIKEDGAGYLCCRT